MWTGASDCHTDDPGPDTGSSSIKVFYLRSETLVWGSSAKVLLRSESLALESAKVPEGRAKVPESRWLRLGSAPRSFPRASVHLLFARSLRHVVTKVPVKV